MQLEHIQTHTVAVGAEVFGAEAMNSKEECLLAMAEEMLELLHAADLPFSKLADLVHNQYFCRPKGEVPQEVACVQFTLYAFAAVNGIKVEQELLAELTRVLENKAAIRAKHDAKPTFMRKI
jgi:hypothetical protein